MNTKHSLLFRRFRKFCLVAGLFSPLLPQFSAHGANVNWNDTTTGDWADGGNWVGGAAPLAADRAYFTGNGTYTVSLAADRSISWLAVTGTGNPEFNFGSSKLTAVLALIGGGSASLTGGTVEAIWYQGNMVNGSTFTLDGPTAKVVGKPGGKVGYSDGAVSSNSNTLFIKNGATFDNSSGTGNFQLGWVSNTSANVTANGNKVEVTGAGSTMSAIEIIVGYITGNTTDVGRQANNNALVINNGGSVTTSLLYLGRIDAGKETSTGNTVTVGGTGSGSTLNVLDTYASSNYSVQIGFGGTSRGANNNVLTVNTGGTVNMNGATTTYINGGTNALKINGGTYNGGDGAIRVEGKLSLGANGSLTTKEIFVYALGRFGNKSDANASFSSGTLNLRTMSYGPTVAFSVGDNVGVDAATYNMVGGGIHSFGAGMIIEKSDGRLTGNGTIQGLSGANTTLTVNGRLAPGNSVGTINLTGDLISGADAIFDFEIASDSSFDQLLITGSSAFNGTLNVSFLDSFAPEVGDSFKLFDFTSTSGSFATLNLAALDAGKIWDTSDLYTSGTLRIAAIPEPSTLGLLMFSGLACAGWLSRRRG